MPYSRGFLYQASKVFERAELRMNCLVAAFRGPDCPRTADVTFGRGDRIVLAFAKVRPDRMNGREIKNVKAEFGDIRQACLAIGKRAVFTGFGGR